MNLRVLVHQPLLVPLYQLQILLEDFELQHHEQLDHMLFVKKLNKLQQKVYILQLPNLLQKL